MKQHTTYATLKEEIRMSATTNYLVTGVLSVLGSLGLLGFILRGQNTKIKEQGDEIKKVKEVNLTNLVEKDNCELLRTNTVLEIKNHISETHNAMKDEIFKELRSIKTTIKNGGSHENT